MKKTIKTMLTAVMVVLMISSFAIAESVATQNLNNFPYFLMGCLVVGGFVLVSLKHKYNMFYMSEAIGVFALYTLMVTMFTDPVIDIIKNLVS